MLLMHREKIFKTMTLCLIFLSLSLLLPENMYAYSDWTTIEERTSGWSQYRIEYRTSSSNLQIRLTSFSTEGLYHRVTGNFGHEPIDIEARYETDTTQTFTGLSPGERYSFYLERILDRGNSRFFIVDEFERDYFFDTKPTTPGAPSFSDSTSNSTNISWNSNGNGSRTTYSLQRRTGGGNWVTVYSGSSTSYQDTNLQTGRTYEYRVSASTNAGYEYSGISTITITPDPAEAAALEARAAAHAAQAASERAETKATEAAAGVNEIKGKVEETNLTVNQLQEDMKGLLLANTSLQWDNNKTATTNTEEWLNVTHASSPDLYYRYQVNGGSFSDWQQISGRIYIYLGPGVGYKNINIQFGDRINGVPLAERSIGIWKL